MLFIVILIYQFFFWIFEEFPLRFETEKNPSVGTMKIFSNSSWQKLCTSQWDEADENLTCMAMGYYSNVVYANGTWYPERGNASEMSTHYNCTIPTTCQNNSEKKQQFCKGNSELHSCNIHMISKDGNLIDLLTLQIRKFFRDQWLFIFGYLLGSKKVSIAKNLVSFYCLHPKTIIVELLPREEPSCAVFWIIPWEML